MDKIEMLFHFNNAVFDLSNSLLRIVRFQNEIGSEKIRKRNAKLKELPKSKRCYVVGLGPSLKDVDFDKIDGDIIATNRYYLFDKEGKYRPTFYCLVDKAFFIGDAQNDFEQILKQYPDTNFILNGKYASSINQEKEPEIKAFYAYMWNGAVKERKKIDFTKILPMSNNVVNIAIMLGIYCGYEEVVLLGCDFNSFAQQHAAHCYEEKNKARKWSLDFELYCYSLAANSHTELAKCAKKHHIKIINATKGSLIDAYEFDNQLIEKIYK